MTDQAKVRRLAERVRELVAEALRKLVKDPRVGLVTVTEVRLTADLRDATVFYTVLGDATEQAATLAALDSAKGLLRSVVGKRLGLRHAPTLTFVTDSVPETARHIEDLLAQARDSDAEVQRQAATARPAGDPQPYRTLDELDPDTDTDANTDAAAFRGAGDRS